VDFAFSEEQEELRDTLRRFFEERAPAAEVRRVMDTPEGFDRALWGQMALELGLPGVHLPEAVGGQGGGFLELGIVVEEMGRVLLPSPYLSNAVACLAVRAAAGDAHPRLAELADGREIGTLALVEEAGRWDAEGVAARAVVEGEALHVTGTKPFVPDGQAASVFVVAAREPGTRGEAGLTLCSVRADAPGVRVTPLETTDRLRRQARLELDGAPAEPLGAPGGAARALRETVARACILLGAEMVGASERALEMAVAYARERVQFGRPVGSFQAIKHKAAEVLQELELARSVAYWALWVADEDGDELEQAAHLAKAMGGDALRRASAENIQIHGGLGFTWEADPHLYYKRWQSADVLYGDATAHRAALARLLGF
jgi:alkylation response protein AidB-like acyl-CoA dehydrogenase